MAKALILCVALWWLMGGAFLRVASKGRWGLASGPGRRGPSWRAIAYRLFLAAVFLAVAVRLTTVLWRWASTA